MVNHNPIDEGRALFGAMILGTAGIAIFAFLPLLVGALVDHMDLAPRQSGFVASADIIGMAVGNLAAVFWIRRVNLRTMARVSVSIIILANPLCVVTSSFEVMLSFRLLIGLAEGTCLALTYAILGRSRHPERYYGIFIVALMTFGAFNLYLLSQLSQAYGAAVFFLDMAIIGVLAAAFIPYLPKGRQGQAHAGEATRSTGGYVSLFRPVIVALLLANLIYFIGQGGVWAYLERIGIAHELSADFIALALSVSLFTGVAGAMTATILSLRMGRLVPLGSAIFLAIASILVLLWTVSAVTFFVAISVWNFVNNFGHPYLLGYMASIDQSGRSVVASGAMQTGGMGLGPAMAALVIVSPMYTNVLWLGLVCFVVTLAMFIPIMLLHQAEKPLSTEG